MVSGERQDVFIRTGFLGQELVAGECNDDKSATFVLLVEEFEILVLGRESAMGRCVDNEHYISLVFRKGTRMSGDTEEDGHGNPTRSPRSRISFSSFAQPAYMIVSSPLSTNTLNSFDKN